MNLVSAGRGEVYGRQSGYHCPVQPDTAVEALPHPLLGTLKKVAAAMRLAGIPAALAGGYAVYARGGALSEHDVDFLIRQSDVDSVRTALEKDGLTLVTPPEDWLIKAYDEDRMVDLIFRPVQRPVTDDMIADSDELAIGGSHVPVISATTLMAFKLLAMNEHACDFAPSLALARSLREQIDWPRLRSDVAESPFALAGLQLIDGLKIAETMGASA
jgi:hypothetical protein